MCKTEQYYPFVLLYLRRIKLLWKLWRRKCTAKWLFPAFNNAQNIPLKKTSSPFCADQRWPLLIPLQYALRVIQKLLIFTGSQMQTSPCDCGDSLHHTAMTVCCLCLLWGHVLLISSKHTIVMPARPDEDMYNHEFIYDVTESLTTSNSRHTIKG